MIDILLDDDFDLLIENGDIVLGDASEQNKRLLLLYSKGDLREDVTVGVGLAGFIKDDEEGDLLGTIKKEFERDGMTVESITFQGDDLTIKAFYP
jgi:hypothetical protein